MSLPDFHCQPGHVLLVGINPSPVSVEVGHYYQGVLGQRAWQRLRQVGLLRDRYGEYEDEAFARAGHGLTDLVKRATPRADGLMPSEIEQGTPVLRQKIREWHPGLIICVFRDPAEALVGIGATPGRCGDFERVPVFRFEGPYSKTSLVDQNLDELRSTLDDLRITRTHG